MDNIDQTLSLADQRLVSDYYDDLKKTYGNRITEEGKERIHKAFVFACRAHAGVRRKSGEPYIIHPIAVASIASGEIGLGATAIIASLLHDVIEDTDYTYEDIKHMFGEEVAIIVDGLTKLSGEIINQQESAQAINFKKMLLTLSNDVRVMLIKLSDRLHNMRTLDSMPPAKQVKISSETLFLFAPLAHRLGLYTIKTELEDWCFKYKEPEAYEDITKRLHNQEAQRNFLIEQLVKPTQKALDAKGLKTKVTGRLKSKYSIWRKMQRQKISFDDVYDLLAIRVVFTPTLPGSEKDEAFYICSTLTDVFSHKPERLRDWISTPKANGYEALHVTIMGPYGKWIETQIRSERMDEIAERGFAAHYKYKEEGNNASDGELDRWLQEACETLSNSGNSATELVSDFKLNLYTSEIITFTPKGEQKKFPTGASVIDFAYEIHSKIGNKCIGAKVNNQLVPISHKLGTGDQVEVLTSESAKPSLEWLDLIATSKAKNYIRTQLQEDLRLIREQGKATVIKVFELLQLSPNAEDYKKILANLQISSKDKLFENVGLGLIGANEIEKILKPQPVQNALSRYYNKVIGKRTIAESTAQASKKNIDPKAIFIIKEHKGDYSIAKCCKPIPGDKVIGYLNLQQGVSIHKCNCDKANELMTHHGDRIITVQWTKFKKKDYPVKVKIGGIDRKGIVNEITTIISKLNNIQMYKTYFEADSGIFKGELLLHVHSLEDLTSLIRKISKLKGIEKVGRID